MNRREFLRSAAIASAGVALRTSAQAYSLPLETRWRTFEVTSEIEVLAPTGPTRVWLPTPLPAATSYQRPVGPTAFDPHGGSARPWVDRRTGATMIAAGWPDGVRPVLKATSRVATRDRAVNLSSRDRAKSLDSGALTPFLRPTSLIPIDGIVRATATKATAGARTDVDKARAIYEWIVENTFREPTVRGCGVGDIRFMLESNNLGGKCADLNALYVGLARAAGLPARDVYGIRVAKSGLGYASLGTASDVITKAQHCRAEVYLTDHGWTPVDPADVRKVILEEPPGHLAMTDAKVVAARQRLFGSWEMNWMAYNTGHDVTLPGASQPVAPFFMYPQAETGGRRIDSLDPDAFRYRITAREVT